MPKKQTNTQYTHTQRNTGTQASTQDSNPKKHTQISIQIYKLKERESET